MPKKSQTFKMPNKATITRITKVTSKGVIMDKPVNIPIKKGQEIFPMPHNEQKHTPQEWTIDPLDPELNNEKEGVAIIDDYGVIQARACDIETAKQILNYANSHAELVETLKEAKEALFNLSGKDCFDSGTTPCVCTACKITDALTLAGVKV